MTCPHLPSPELFDNYMQQDAHEFLNYLLNTIADLLQEEKSQERQQNGKLVQNGSGGGGCGDGGGGGGEGDGGKGTQQTWVHEIFQGTLTNETRCLNCEAVSWVFTSAASVSQSLQEVAIATVNTSSLLVCRRVIRNSAGQ